MFGGKASVWVNVVDTAKDSRCAHVVHVVLNADINGFNDVTHSVYTMTHCAGGIATALRSTNAPTQYTLNALHCTQHKLVFHHATLAHC